MKQHCYWTTVCILALFALGVSADFGFGEDSRLSAKDILKRMQKSFEEIEDYTVTLDETIKMEGVKIPKREVKLYYKKPNKVHIESKDIAFIPRGGIVINPSYHLKEHFKPLGVEEEILEGIRTYRLTLTSKEASLGKKAMLWVESKHWSPKKMEITGWEGGTVLVQIEHAIVEGKYWLPKSTLVELNIPSKTPKRRVFESLDDFDARKERLSVRPRKGTVSISFRDYKVNTGLCDEIFERKNDH